jgi:hypothetical protein
LTKPDENGTAGADATHQTMIVLKLDLETFQVALGGDVMPISLAQMMCEEALRVLGEQRRLAAAKQLGEAIQDAARTKEILDRVGGRRQ